MFSLKVNNENVCEKIRNNSGDNFFLNSSSKNEQNLNLNMKQERGKKLETNH